MKYGIIMVVGALLLIGGCGPDRKPELKDQKDKESYSLGYKYGESFKKDGVAIAPEVFTAGLRDALDGKEARMTSAEMDATIEGLRKRGTAARQQRLKEQFGNKLFTLITNVLYDINLTDMGTCYKAFLAENAKKAGVKTLPSGLQYRVLAEGSGRRPKAGDTVAVRYRGTLIDGTEFDSTPTGDEPATFPVDRVIPGWTEALQLMQEGAKWQLFVPSELGYGRRGMPRIPPHSVLIFEVELVAVK